jgi:hypothetical protein
MESTTSMTTSLVSYIWLVVGACVLKALGFNARAVDLVFFVLVLVTMFVVYSAIMKVRCGETALGPVFQATFGPWLFMLGGIMLILYVFPGWRQPFSNTFGYMVILFPMIGAKQKLLDLLVPSSSIDRIVKNPSLMLNEFSGSTFDDTIKKLQGENIVRADANVADFKKIILLKETIADSVWYILVGCVAVTTSFNVLMNYTCQKKSTLNEVLPEVPEEPVTKYIITD